jgi:hypothetical protein
LPRVAAGGKVAGRKIVLDEGLAIVNYIVKY